MRIKSLLIGSAAIAAVALPALAVAKVAFAKAFEDFGRGIAGSVLDLGVAVDERQAEALGKASPDRRLANPHQTDQHYRPVETLSQFHTLKGLYSGYEARQKRLPCQKLPF